jgi:hypothetical protein
MQHGGKPDLLVIRHREAGSDIFWRSSKSKATGRDGAERAVNAGGGLDAEAREYHPTALPMKADMHVRPRTSMNVRILQTGLACAVLFGTTIAPNVARAATPSPTATPAAPPISIADGCSYKTMSSGFGFGNSGVIVSGHGYNFFTVKFTNNAAVAATKIVFQIDFGKASRIAIPDVGTFAPGSTTQTTFRDKGNGMVFSARPTPNDGSVICTVLSATFADGTSYLSPLASATP